MFQYYYVINKDLGYNFEWVVIGVNNVLDVKVWFVVCYFYEGFLYVEVLILVISYLFNGYSGQMILDEKGMSFFFSCYDFIQENYVVFMGMVIQ